MTITIYEPSATSLALEFSSEAHDTAGEGLRRFEGFAVQVHQKQAPPYDAVIRRLFVDDEDGQWKIVVSPWGTEQKLALDIYEDIDRLVVI